MSTLMYPKPFFSKSVILSGGARWIGLPDRTHRAAVEGPSAYSKWRVANGMVSFRQSAGSGLSRRKLISPRISTNGPEQGPSTARGSIIPGKENFPPRSAQDDGIFDASVFRRGFTLVEMMITLAVFMLLAAAVFAVLSGVLQGASALTDNQNRTDEVVALKAYLDKRISELPAPSTLTSYQRGDGEGLVQNGIVFGTASFASALDAKVQPNGYYTLRLSNYESVTVPGQPPLDARQVLSTAASTDDPTLTWTPLMSDVKTLDWKFLDFNATLWVEIWSSGTKPNLMELSMQLAGDLQPTTMDFWVPKISNVPGGNAQQAR